MQSLVTDPYFHGIDEDPYVAPGYASASQVVGWVTFYADGVELDSVRIYGTGGLGSVSLDTTLPVGAPVITAEYVCDYAYHADTTSDGVTVTVDEDTTDPVFSAFTVTPDDGALDASGEESVSYSVTVTDDCCIDPDDITITPSVTNGSVKDLVTDKSPSSGATTEVVVSGTFTVYDVTACPAVPSVEIEATDLAGNAASASKSGSGIDDVTDPTVSSFTVTNDADELDASGEATGSFSLTVSDNSCLQPSAITIDGSATNGSVEILTLDKLPSSGTTTDVDVSGTYRVYDSTGCPVTPTFDVTATDCCGNEATASEDGASITDTIDPTISALTVTTEDGELDGAGEEPVAFSFTVSDNACIGPSDIVVDVSVTNGELKDLVVTKVPSSGTATEVNVSGSFTVYELTDCTATPRIDVTASDCCSNSVSDSETGSGISDTTRPTVSDFTVAWDDGVVDGNCEETVSYSLTLSDNNCLDPADITITPSTMNASVKDLVVTKTPSSGTTKQVIVTGTFVVYDLTGGTAIPTVQVSCDDCCGWTRVDWEDGSGIVDAAPPAVSSSSVTVADGQVDGDCEEVIEYQFTVTDNCCLDPSNIRVTPDASSDYSVKDHVMQCSPSDGTATEVLVTGSFTVYDLISCPVTPSVTLSMTDCSGNEFTQSYGGGGR